MKENKMPTNEDGKFVHNPSTKGRTKQSANAHVGVEKRSTKVKEALQEMNENESTDEIGKAEVRRESKFHFFEIAAELEHDKVTIVVLG